MLLGILLLGALRVEGDLKLAIDQAVYLGPDAAAVVELGYDVPFSSLTFLKTDTGYRARFTVGLQLFDRSGSPQAGDVWQREVLVSDYEAAVARDSSVAGVVSLLVPKGVTRGLAEVIDLGSDRKARAGFTVVEPGAGIAVRLFRQGRPNPGRTYALDDTLDVYAELPAGLAAESARFEVRDGRKTRQAGMAAVFDTLGRRAARWQLAMADSGQTARLGSGSYRLDVRAGAVAGRAEFTVQVPFFASDQDYQDRVDRLLYVATQDKIRELKQVPRAERESAWQAFWRDKDPTPTTSGNEREDTYFERIAYADQHFGGADRGYRSDRGRVYVRYGPPDNVDSRPFEIDARPYEVWHYYDLSLTFTFVDRYGFGEYLLASPLTDQ